MLIRNSDVERLCVDALKSVPDCEDRVFPARPIHEVAHEDAAPTPMRHVLVAWEHVGKKIALLVGSRRDMAAAFLARMRAIVQQSGDDPGASVSLGNLRHDRHSGAIYCRDAVLDLAPRELALLQALMARPGHAVSKEHLFEQVFPGAEDVQYEAIEVVAYRLRKKLAHSGAMLVTLRGLGYLLKVAT